ncbi:MAG: aminoacyl-histidine dipeptidase [Paludibacteraceae bacterium]|nr:aminoacyl-histidine dipeptidase [Paludibacteraceae bacterium]
MNIQELQPQEVFSIFHEITQVPRPSKREGKIIEWLKAFAVKHNLFHTVDEAGNIIMRKPATPGYEDKPGVILQAHMDMVCEKNNDTVHDFDNDPIHTYIDGDFIKAEGTTLGADNGIGMALMLAAITSDTLKHPALECLFTVDEETGLTGAFRLKDGCLNGKQLINLDSEDDGQVFIGCAGGIDTLAKMYYVPEPVEQEAKEGLLAVHIKVSGLMGGHSGDDINKGRGNANKILVRFLYQVMKATDMYIASLNGGNLRNAIAREAEAVIVLPIWFKENVRVMFNHYVATIESEISDVEKDFAMSLETTDMPAFLIPQEQSERLIQALYACPHGMMAMSKTMPGLVETSTNLASVKMKEDDKGTYIEVNTSQRSSIESKKHDLKQMVECALALACDEVTHGDGYPGWAPNPQSPLLEVTKKAYQDLFAAEPKVLAIHAGLECGLFLEKYPYLDMVSIGPQMFGVHSPQERLSISSTGKCWQWLQRVLETL